MTILGVDVSHFQGAPNWAQVKASGRDFCVLKATEGTTYRDPSFASNRAAAHAAGLIVGFYHFARLGSPAAEAAWFAKTVGPLQPGEFVVLDYEPNPVPPGSAPWSKQWLDATRANLGVAPLIYMNTYTMGVDNWSAVAKDYGLWLAKYDQSTAPSPTKWWPTEAMKQDNDKSLVVGIIGGVDDDVFYGTREQLLAYGYQGADMPLTDADAAVIWNHILDMRNGSGPATAADWLRDGRVDAGQAVAQLTGTNVGAFNADVRGDLANKATQLDAIQAAAGKDGDPAVLAEAVVTAMGAEFAQKVIDALGQRINATQPPTS